EVVVDGRDARVLERREQEGLAFEVADRFLVLAGIEMRLHHLFHSARRVTEVAVLREIDSAHAAATDAAHDLVTSVQYCVGWKLLGSRLMSAGRAAVMRSRA